ncbi:MAG: hypothetical protein AAF958_14725 [Planctomycetota bacterium]
MGDGIEIELRLVGVDPDVSVEYDHVRSIYKLSRAARRHSDVLQRLVSGRPDRRGHRHRVFLPRPKYGENWIRAIAPNRILAGVIYLAGDDQSLNSRLVEAGLPAAAGNQYSRPDWDR